MADEYRSFSGEIRNLQKKNEFLFDVTLRLVNNSVTKNNWQFLDMEGHKNTFAGKPLLIAYEYGKIGGGHNATKKVGKDGKEYLSFTGSTDERIIGSISDDPNDIWVETDSAGIEWIYANGSIWTWYAREAVEKIERDTADGKPMSISIEALVSKSEMDGEIERELSWEAIGVTLLGDNVAPAVTGAHIRALSEESGFENLKLRAASFLDTSGDEGEKEEPHANTQIKPQNEKIVKEKEAIMKAFSKKQLATLSAKFPEYSLLTAGQDDNGVHVCMMGADGEMAVYTMADMNETIVPEKTLHVNSQVVFEFGEDKLAVDLCDVTDQMSANAVKANSKIEKLEKDLETANETIRTMQTAEKARRVKACTDKVDALVAEFNAAREDKIDCAMFNSIKEAINNGDYSECVDSKGCWNGEQMVTLAAKAVMTDFQMEVDKRNASRNKSQYVWEMSADKNGGSDDVVSFIENFSFD